MRSLRITCTTKAKHNTPSPLRRVTKHNIDNDLDLYPLSLFMSSDVSWIKMFHKSIVGKALNLQIVTLALQIRKSNPFKMT